MFIPNTLRQEALQACHDALAAGHFSLRKTRARFYRRFWWPKCHQALREYVKTCTECQQYKKSTTHPTGNMKSTQTCFPFDRLVLDVLGPISISRGAERYMVVAVDAF